jgi:hypothetical protein
LKKREDLIYDLLFSEREDFKVEVSGFIEDIYKYDRFIDDMKKILKKSKVNIEREKVSINQNSVIWEIKVKR